MKRVALLLTLAFAFQSCGEDDPEPAKVEAALTGKWNNINSEERTHNANGTLKSTGSKTYNAGVQTEYLENGAWKQYDNYAVVDNGSYTRNGSKITVVVSGTTFVSYIQSLTANELLTRDTIRYSDNTYKARLNKATR